jgi:uncharacterized membrane protein HdeD (DUF308 family)
MGTKSTDAQMSSAFRKVLRHHSVMFLIEGIVLLVLGVLAVLAAFIAPQIASLGAALFFGWILLLSGCISLISTFLTRHAPGTWWSLLSAVIGIAAGVLLLIRPVQGAPSLTAVLIAFLVLEGIVSIFYALEHRRGLSGRWGWMLMSGVLDLLLAVILWAGLPATAFWALALLLGINLIFGGWSLILMALAARTANTAVS